MAGCFWKFINICEFCKKIIFAYYVIMSVNYIKIRNKIF